MAAGRGGARLYSQHLGGRGWRISEFKASLVYRVSSRTAGTVTQRDPVCVGEKGEIQSLRIYIDNVNLNDVSH